MNTKEFIQKLRAKPEYVRRRIAFGTSVGITAVVAIAWGATMATTGAFALSTGASVADSGSQSGQTAFPLDGTNVKSNFSQLMGAVGAASGATSSQPALTIIDGTTSSSFDTESSNNSSATVIPF